MDDPRTDVKLLYGAISRRHARTALVIWRYGSPPDYVYLSDLPGDRLLARGQEMCRDLNAGQSGYSLAYECAVLPAVELPRDS